MSEKYPFIQSTLEGIFSADIGYAEKDMISQLQADLLHPPFKSGFSAELIAAFQDHSLSWRKMLLECGVAAYDTEQEAISFAKKYLWDATFINE